MSGHIGLRTKTKDDFRMKIKFNTRRNRLVHQYGRRFFVWKSNMAAVKSYANDPIAVSI